MWWMIFEVIRRPLWAFNRISKNGKKYWLAAFLIAVVFPAIFSLSIVGVITLENALLNAGSWLVTLVAVYYVGKLLKGKSKFMGVFSCMGYAAIPGFVIALCSVLLTLMIPRGLLEELKGIPSTASQDTVVALIQQVFSIPVIIVMSIIVAMIIWGFILSIVAIEITHKFHKWKAVLTLLLSWIVTVIIMGGTRALVIGIISVF